MGPGGGGEMNDFYNDNDRHAAAWMRELIKQGHLPEGEVDETDIRELGGERLKGFRRVHLFAGVGGWAWALELAGWPRERPIWSGSCPCQPFSSAGQRKGEQDERHLWPHMLRLIQECRPPVVFGEQVSGSDGYRWLAGIQNDLEATGYAFGAADLPACCVGSPIIRQRLWWVARAPGPRSRTPTAKDKESTRRRNELGRTSGAASRWLSRANESQFQRVASTWNEPGDGENDVLLCTDGKYRRTQSGLYPLASRVSGGVAYMRGYGNSIVAKTAAAFIQAFLESEAELSGRG